MKIEDVRFYISKYSIYIFVYCLMFLLQRAILLHFFNARQYILFNKIYWYEIILAIISFLEVRFGIKISRPE